MIILLIISVRSKSKTFDELKNYSNIEYICQLITFLDTSLNNYSMHYYVLKTVNYKVYTNVMCTEILGT